MKVKSRVLTVTRVSRIDFNDYKARNYFDLFAFSNQQGVTAYMCIDYRADARNIIVVMLLSVTCKDKKKKINRSCGSTIHNHFMQNANALVIIHVNLNDYGHDDHDDDDDDNNNDVYQ